MVRFSKISPMVRAIGTMGTVAALVGAVTFAQITSNTVALTNNTLSSATASLAIGAAHDCSTGATTSVQGMSFNNLQPGVASSPFPFCLDNTGNVPLNLTASVPTNFGAGINPNDVTLHFTCGVGGATTGAVNVSTTVGALHTSPVAFGTAALNNGTNNVLSCDVTATITPAASTTSNESLTPFDIQFVGTSTDTANPTTLNNTSATV
jgi:hypothetical protein